MDFNNDTPPVNNQVNNNTKYSTNQPNGMATASLVLGILAVVSFCCINGSYLFGGIAITLGLLSRGNSKKLSTNALVGIILSIAGMVISTIVISIYCISLLANYSSVDDFMKDSESYFENFYGEDYPFDSNAFDYKYDEDTQPEESILPNTLTITID